MKRLSVLTEASQDKFNELTEQNTALMLQVETLQARLLRCRELELKLVSEIDYLKSLVTRRVRRVR